MVEPKLTDNALADRPSRLPPSESSVFLTTIQHNIDRAADIVRLPDHVRTILSQPKNELIGNFPVRMEAGS